MMKTERLTILPITDKQVKKISELNPTTDLDIFLASISEQDKNMILNDAEGTVQAMLSMLNAVKESDMNFGGFLQDELIGYVCIKGYKTSTPELQIEIVPAYQNQGYGYELLKEVLDVFSSSYEYSHICYRVVPTNEASIRLVEKVGGVLQTPESSAEKILFKTYYIQH